MMSKITPWLLASRPKTLLVALAVILLGQTLALHDASDSFSYFIAVSCVLCCFSLQVAVNFANDYFDAIKGIDGNDRVGPVRAVQNGLIQPAAMRRAIIIMCILASLSGGYLIILGGWPFVLLGLLSLAGVYLYSGGPKPIASNAMGEIAVFLYFGWLAVIGSYYLQTELLSWTVFIPASEIGLLVAAIMLVNNIRDIDTDNASGKFTLATRLGEGRSKQLYYLLMLFPTALLFLDSYQPGLLFVLLPLQLGLCWLMHKRSGAALNVQLAQTSLSVLLWAVFYTASLLS